MPLEETTAERRRRVALQSMRRVTGREADEEFRRFCGSVGWSEWDESATRFLHSPQAGPIFTGRGDAGHQFVFSPAARAGYWTVEQDNLRGKGVLLPAGVAALTEIAEEKGLLPSTR